MEKVKAFWESLPSTAKVFVYLLVSGVLAELALDLNVIGDVWWAHYLLIPINLAIVLIQKDVPEVYRKLRK